MVSLEDIRPQNLARDAGDLRYSSYPLDRYALPETYRRTSDPELAGKAGGAAVRLRYEAYEVLVHALYC